MAGRIAADLEEKAAGGNRGKAFSKKVVVNLSGARAGSCTCLATNGRKTWNNIIAKDQKAPAVDAYIGFRALCLPHQVVALETINKVRPLHAASAPRPVW
jgi:hypothetical protein